MTVAAPNHLLPASNPAMDTEEALKALSLARKHDQAGNTAAALKWAQKSVSIASLPEAIALVSRLEKSGASGASSSSTSTSIPSSDTARSRPNASTASFSNGSAKPEAPKARAYTPEQLEVVKKVRSAGGDFYKVLGVEKGSEEAVMKKAYRKVSV